MNPDLTSDTAVIIGQGNVAIDVARILLSGEELLKVLGHLHRVLHTPCAVFLAEKSYEYHDFYSSP